MKTAKWVAILFFLLWGMCYFFTTFQQVMK